MFIFWYRFVLPELSRISTGFGGDVCDEVFAEHLSSHVGRAFEECAIQYMWRALKKKTLPVSFRRIGRWWGNNPAQRREEEIDFIAYSGDKAVFGECKWRSIPTGEDVLVEAMRKAKLFSSFTDVHYMLFSKSGFSEPLERRAAHSESITLVGIEEMFLISR